MSKNPYGQNRDELRELLEQYNNLVEGKAHSFIEEEGFERIVDYYDEKEKYNKAFEAAELGCNQYPYSAALLIKKADILISLRKYRESLDVLEQAELLDASDGSLFIIRADAFLALDMQEDAHKIFDYIIEYFEGDERIDLLFELSEVYDDYENFEMVFDCLKIILELDPSNEEALYKICFWTDFTGRNEEGISLHLKIIEEFPYNELAWFNLGAAYQGLKLYEKAIDAYQYAVAIDEKFDYAYRNMGDAYIKLRKFKDAIEVLEKVLDLSRPEALLYEAIGHCYDKLKNYSQARNNYKKACHLNPEDSQMHYKLALTYMNEAAWDNALKSLQSALKAHVMQPEYNLAAGQCYMQLGNTDEALTYFGNVIRVRPKNVTGWVELLKCLYHAEFYEEGIEYASYAYEHTDSKPIFGFYRSLFLFAAGKLKEALVSLENSMKVNPKLIKNILELNPSLLQHQQVVDLIAGHKKNIRRKK
jgi:tetratricopeptide (TPR) repeat protein